MLCAVRATGLWLTGTDTRDAAALKRLSEAKAAERIFVPRPATFP